MNALDPIADDVDLLLGSLETAQAFGLEPQTVRKWRVTDSGPRYLRDSQSGRILYPWSALVEFAERTNRRLRFPVGEISE